MPRLLLHGPNGEELEAQYAAIFIREPGVNDIGGSATGDVVVVAESHSDQMFQSAVAVDLGISLYEIRRTDRILLRLSPTGPDHSWYIGHSGQMILSSEPFAASRYDLLVPTATKLGGETPRILVSRELVERLLAHSGESLDDLLDRLPPKCRRRRHLPPHRLDGRAGYPRIRGTNYHAQRAGYLAGRGHCHGRRSHHVTAITMASAGLQTAPSTLALTTTPAV